MGAKGWRTVFALSVLLASAFALAGGGGLEGSQKIAELRINESALAFLLKLPSSTEAQVLYMWTFGVTLGMLFTWFSKWRFGLADARYFVDHYRWTIGSIVASLSIGLGGIATGVFETASGEFIGWWSVLYHAGVAGAAVDWSVNKGNGAAA